MVAGHHRKGILMSALNNALVAVAKAANVGGKVFADGKVDLKDVGVIIGNLGELQGLAGIDLAGVVVEAGKLTEAAKASAVAAFKAAFDLPQDVLESAVEEAVDACLTLLLGALKAKNALGAILPKAA